MLVNIQPQGQETPEQVRELVTELTTVIEHITGQAKMFIDADERNRLFIPPQQDFDMGKYRDRIRIYQPFLDGLYVLKSNE